MKRFYCKICQKIRHVRRMPSSVTTPFAEKPSDRIGECAWHSTRRISRPVNQTRKVS